MSELNNVSLVVQGKLGITKFIKIRNEWINESLLMQGAITEYGENICWDANNFYEGINPRLKISKENQLLNSKKLINGNLYAKVKVIGADEEKYFVEVFEILKA